MTNQMQLPGHITFTLRTGEAFSHVPNHLDFVLGTTRAALRLDGGVLDRVIRKWGGGGRTQRLGHAALSAERRVFVSPEAPHDPRPLEDRDILPFRSRRAGWFTAALGWRW